MTMELLFVFMVEDEYYPDTCRLSTNDRVFSTKHIYTREWEANDLKIETNALNNEEKDRRNHRDDHSVNKTF